MEVIKPVKSIQDAVYIKDFKFACGHSVPIYQVNSIHSLTQIIGYVKYINASYGNVLYRGQCRLYDTIKPGIYGNVNSEKAKQKRDQWLDKAIENAKGDKAFSKFIHLENNSKDKEMLESVFQHYGIPTHYIDVVDNHWIALWFGVYKYISYINNSFCKYKMRSTDINTALLHKIGLSDAEFDAYLSAIREDMYQYILLIAASRPEKPINEGIMIGADTISVDLRRALPSTFLRPHAQHGWTIKKKSKSSDYDLDLADHVVGILRISVCDALKWLGNGELLTQESLFPNPNFDQGYNVLLNHAEFFAEANWKIPIYVS